MKERCMSIIKIIIECITKLIGFIRTVKELIVGKHDVEICANSQEFSALVNYLNKIKMYSKNLMQYQKTLIDESQKIINLLDTDKTNDPTLDLNGLERKIDDCIDTLNAALEDESRFNLSDYPLDRINKLNISKVHILLKDANTNIELSESIRIRSNEMRRVTLYPPLGNSSITDVSDKIEKCNSLISKLDDAICSASDNMYTNISNINKFEKRQYNLYYLFYPNIIKHLNNQ